MVRLAISVLMAFYMLPVWSQECMIAIDVGHTQKAYGATSARGVGEWQFNIALARLLATSLKKEEIPFVLINPEGESIALRERPEAALKAGATLFISIHHDSVQPHYLSEWVWEGKKRLYSDHFNGYSLFVSAKNSHYQESLAVAEKIADGLIAGNRQPTRHHAEPISGENRLLLDKDRGIYQFDELVVLREAPAAAILVEAGVIVNRDEELEVSGGEYQEKMVSAISSAVKDHCSQFRKTVQ